MELIKNFIHQNALIEVTLAALESIQKFCLTNAMASIFYLWIEKLSVKAYPQFFYKCLVFESNTYQKLRLIKSAFPSKRNVFFW